MAEYIYVKIGDKHFEEVFKEKFKGIVLRTQARDGTEYQHVVPIDKLLSILQKEADEVWMNACKEHC